MKRAGKRKGEKEEEEGALWQEEPSAGAQLHREGLPRRTPEAHGSRLIN